MKHYKRNISKYYRIKLEVATLESAYIVCLYCAGPKLLLASDKIMETNNQGSTKNLHQEGRLDTRLCDSILRFPFIFLFC